MSRASKHFDSPIEIQILGHPNNISVTKELNSRAQLTSFQKSTNRTSQNIPHRKQTKNTLNKTPILIFYHINPLCNPDTRTGEMEVRCNVIQNKPSASPRNSTTLHRTLFFIYSLLFIFVCCLFCIPDAVLLFLHTKTMHSIRITKFSRTNERQKQNRTNRAFLSN